jgi:hypothetical protein
LWSGCLTEEEGIASTPSEVTDLLERWSAGDESARDRLIPLVYDRLRQLAHRRLANASVEGSLNTTALVHEAYPTAKRGLRCARAWLALELSGVPLR